MPPLINYIATFQDSNVTVKFTAYSMHVAEAFANRYFNSYKEITKI